MALDALRLTSGAVPPHSVHSKPGLVCRALAHKGTNVSYSFSGMQGIISVCLFPHPRIQSLLLFIRFQAINML